MVKVRLADSGSVSSASVAVQVYVVAACSCVGVPDSVREAASNRSPGGGAGDRL